MLLAEKKRYTSSIASTKISLKAINLDLLSEFSWSCFGVSLCARVTLCIIVQHTLKPYHRMGATILLVPDMPSNCLKFSLGMVKNSPTGKTHHWHYHHQAKRTSTLPARGPSEKTSARSTAHTQWSFFGTHLLGFENHPTSWRLELIWICAKFQKSKMILVLCRSLKPMWPMCFWDIPVWQNVQVAWL